MEERKQYKIQTLSELYCSVFGMEPEGVSRLAGAGSNRVYFRMRGDVKGEGTVIGVESDDLKESRGFVGLSRLFGRYGLPVPRVLGESEDYRFYLQTDLGPVSLFDIIKKEGEGSERVKRLVKESLSVLVRMQTLPELELESVVEYPRFSVRQAMWDLNYFKYEYLKVSGFSFDEEALENDFEKLAGLLGDCSGSWLGFMFRDFQSRNVMIKDEVPYLIDYQGGRIGPMIYDAISFLWQAKAGFSSRFRSEMLDFYFAALKGEDGARAYPDAGRERMVVLFTLFRTLQVLGAYGFRGLVEKKAHFIESIPSALRNLGEILEQGDFSETIGVSLPELQRVCSVLIRDSRFVKEESPAGGDGEKAKRLRVTVFSFSYKKGYPADYTGNGGGYMFDCRGMHNPGRYAEYKSLTGLDRPVIEFLEERGEVFVFAENAMRMVEGSVETYKRRGFSDLQIGFGCTGGQHRSVYCAERVGRMLAEKYPDVIVEVVHREQKKGRSYNN